ncbi:MAG: hypothetical protein GY913_26375 [Proteobacteria bacterium]|nr:hypothetical protein [Pseudomonadota bacterium]
MILLIACAATVPSVEVDPSVIYVGDGRTDDTSLEHIEGVDRGTGGEILFDDTVIHVVTLEIRDSAWRSLETDPRGYTKVAFIHDDGREVDVGVKLKGNTQFRNIEDKPSLVLDFNRYDEHEHWDGVPSVYVHNLTYDPSNLHEHLAYLYFRSVQAPASRSAYAHLTINGEDYGIYMLLEKQNAVYNKRWWDEGGGGTWEAGSFNHPCDFNDPGCDCWEEDTPGDFTAVQDLCDIVQTGDFYDDTQDVVDWDELIRSATAEMAIAHYDNYGWNTNNYRVHRTASDGVFHWTPWSTDLAFGWYPWSGAPHCGEYGTVPSDHDYGVMMQRCWGDAVCRTRLLDELEWHADQLEAADLVSEMETRITLIDEISRADAKSWYSVDQMEAEQACMRTWIEQRPDWLRTWVATQR